MELNETQSNQSETHAELVFAIVAPVGTDYRQVAEHLCSQLGEFRYTGTQVFLSELIESYSHELGLKPELTKVPEFERIRSHMRAANEVYREFNKLADANEENALLAIGAVEKIFSSRSSTGEGRRALLSKAHVLLTLKRPEEVTYLRKIYGVGLHVIAVFATEEERTRHLTREKGLSQEEARILINDDRDDQERGGQRTRDAFELADLFIDVGRSDDWKREVGRFLDILFSHPYKTPTKDEQAMFMAYSASLRSAQFGRQVGAAITNHEGDLLAIGCNEVPLAHGGQYWPGDDVDERDHHRGCDSNDKEKGHILEEILEIVSKQGNVDVAAVREKLRLSSLFSITEYGRAVHAEMEALGSCARRGIATQGKTLYSTTFPCHNCARHIIGFGISRVVYIEPYPKSKAAELHDDAINISEEARTNSSPSKIPFVPFVGISPRKYAELFTIKPMYGKEVDRKLKGSGKAISWRRSNTNLRLQMTPFPYIEREQLALKQITDVLEKQRLRTEMQLNGEPGHESPQSK